MLICRIITADGELLWSKEFQRVPPGQAVWKATEDEFVFNDYKLEFNMAESYRIWESIVDFAYDAAFVERNSTMVFQKDIAYGTDRVKWSGHHTVNMAFKAGPGFVSAKLNSPDVTGLKVDNNGVILCKPDRTSAKFVCTEQ